MTQAMTLNVEYQELMDRADELEFPLPAQPFECPQAPSALAHATGAAEQLWRSVTDMRNYMITGQREWAILAESLRNAAKAYEEVDEGAAESIATGSSMSGATAGVTDVELEAFTASDTPPLAEPLPTYYPVRQAAYDIADPDQGVAFDRFAEEWTAYRATLLDATTRFRPFQYWEGDARYAVEASMEQQRTWLFKMADLCGTMAGQARSVAAAQRWALPRHPTIAQIEKIDSYWVLYQTDPALQPYWPEVKVQMEQNYAAMQEQSEEVLAEYAKQASLPLSPAQPSLPPAALKVPPPPADAGDGSDHEKPDTPTDEMPYNDPSAGSGGSSAATPDTSGDQTPTDPPAYPPTTLPPGLPTGGGVKPASFGGGGGGMPAMPLQPAVEAEAAPRPTTTAPGAGLLGAAPGARGPMGGGMGGMPMGGQGQNQNDKKGKRVQQEDEALYKEDRPWTAPVIGNRRRNDLPGGEHDAA